VANINIVRKDRSDSTRWIIAGIVLLGLLIWFMFFRDRGRVVSESSQGAVSDSAFRADSGVRSR
jgi:hypothetical protein